MIARLFSATMASTVIAAGGALVAQEFAPARVAREEHANVPGVRIFFMDTGGTGEPIVFLHASTGTTQAWQYQMPAFAAAGYRAIAYHRRGWADR